MSFPRKIIIGLLALCMVLSAVPVSAGAETRDAFGTLLQHIESEERKWQNIGTVYERVPFFFQTDYPDTPYGNGTVSSSGCGITALAMVASYLLDETYSPDILAEAFGSYEGTNVERMLHASEAMGLSLVRTATKWDHVIWGLRNEYIVLLLVNEKTAFTGSQHFLVLTDTTSDNDVWARDPYEPNYWNPDLMEGFSEGFEEEEVSIGFDGGWVYRKQPRTLPSGALEWYRNIRGMDWNIDIPEVVLHKEPVGKQMLSRRSCLS